MKKKLLKFLILITFFLFAKISLGYEDPKESFKLDNQFNLHILNPPPFEENWKVKQDIPFFDKSLSPWERVTPNIIKKIKKKFYLEKYKIKPNFSHGKKSLIFEFKF
jgi:hypothetical protein